MTSTPKNPETFVKIYRHRVMRQSLIISDGRIRGPVGVLPATFTLVGRNKLHQFLILSKNLL